MKDELNLLAMRREKLIKQHKSCYHGNQHKERGSQADEDLKIHLC